MDQLVPHSRDIALTKELTEQLRKNRTIDWNRKETSRARMRVLVKRLLKKYKYPPEGQEAALKVVMEQCNKWADDDENLKPIIVNITLEHHYHEKVDKVINIGTNTENDFELGSVKVAEPLEDPE